ncbi:GEVED domain-containing protein [Thiofilum flexile]|uniref:GEVED domain-containing protein n=1 Tax=Thiofilum flexile TaxID=125627 RepID=UPI000364372D|nr:GEVED domain-containing protein [Thiofilum flexile]
MNIAPTLIRYLGLILSVWLLITLEVSAATVAAVSPPARCTTNSVHQLDAMSWADAYGAGAAGVPTLTYTAPTGNKRMLFALLMVERDHSPLTTRGDNYASPYPLGSAATLSNSPTLTFGGVAMTKGSAQYAQRGSGSAANAEISREMYSYYLMESDIPAGANSFTLPANFNLPLNAGDEATLVVGTFGNVYAAEWAGEVQDDSTAPFSVSLTTNPAASGIQPAGTTAINNMLLAWAQGSKSETLNYNTAWSRLFENVLTNTNGSYATDASRVSGPYSENDGFSMVVEAISGVTGNRTPSAASPSNNLYSLGLQAIRLVAAGCDYADAPASYGTPVHGQSTDLYLGSVYGDAETAAQSGAAATDDDTTTVDDEDGVGVFPALNSSDKNYTLMATVTNTSGSEATLHGWIDMDGNGTFDSDEHTSVVVPTGASASTATLYWPNLPGLTTGVSYVRLRLSTDNLTDASTAASDGEVEDYQLLIATSPLRVSACNAEPLDFSGISDNTPTIGPLFTNRLLTVGNSSFPGVTFSNSITEISGSNSGSFTEIRGNNSGDFALARDNKTGVLTASMLFSQPIYFGISEDKTLVGDTEPPDQWTLTVNNGASFNLTDPGTQDISVQSLTPNSITFNILNGDDDWDIAFAKVTSLEARFYSNGIDNTSILNYKTCLVTWDASDTPAEGVVAPDGSSITAYGEATHTVTPSLRLGAAIDIDISPIATSDASGEGSDDDGVSMPTLWQGDSEDVIIPAANLTGVGIGTLHAWIDFNGDGVFGTNEYASVAFNNGAAADLMFSGYGSTLVANTTFARFRLTTSDLSAADAATDAADGEVEDYQVLLTDPDPDKDGLTTKQEAILGTDPLDPDTDNDGLLDGQEDANHNSAVDAGETNPLDADSDDDGLLDGQEDANKNGVVDSGETNSLDADTDKDGLQDGTEQGITTPIPGGTSSGTTPVNYAGTDTTVFIPDSDPVTTTNPLNPDTDAGGVCDGSLEVSGVCRAGEDANNNGLVDNGETDPNQAADDPQPTLKLQLRAMLQGAYTSATGLMRDDLRSRGFLPLQQPYAVAPYAYTGTEATTSTLLAVTGSDAVVDWILVELRDASGTTVLARQAALLQRDGDLMESSSASLVLQFPTLTSGDYQIVLRHRNHLDIRTLNAVSLNTNTATLVDFTLPTTLTLGTHSQQQSGSMTLMWTGDTNVNQNIIGAGPDLDTNKILGQVFTAAENTSINSNYVLSGYYIGDLNLDGNTIFSGPNNDVNQILANILLHPLNNTLSANYVIIGGLMK